MTTDIKTLLDMLEPLPANASVDTLRTTGLGEVAHVSMAISMKRIADVLTGDNPLTPTLIASLERTAWECGRAFKSGNS